MYRVLGNYQMEHKVYNAGIYVRLSQEDEKIGQSESITNQKDFIYNYVLDKGWNVADVYIDDGFTGTNFDRPGFQSLIADIEAGKVNLVITKDMSRLGRDYIETGHYIERYFPMKNVRYIAITDGIDTFDVNSSSNDMTPFKAVFNDLYAKDISKKIRATMDNKRYNGQFIGAFPPYGYAKDGENKNKLIIDETAANVVRYIYDMYVNGTSMSKITDILNDEGVPSPNEYKKQTSTYSNVNAKFNIWTQQTVKSILSNPTYRGNMTQGRSMKINYKTKKFRKIRRENWIIAENTHEPIIDADTYELVQTMLEKYASIDYGKKAPHLFSGLLYCGDCGFPMTFRRENKSRFVMICTNYSRHGKCSRHQVYEEELNQIVLDDLNRIAKKVLNSKKIVQDLSSDMPKRKTSHIKPDTVSIEKRLNEIKNIIKSLYDDKVRGLITEDTFIEMMQSYNEEKEVLANKQYKNIAKAETKKNQPTLNYVKLIEDVITFKQPNKALLTQLIDKIEVFEIDNGRRRYTEKEIKVQYTFPKP